MVFLKETYKNNKTRIFIIKKKHNTKNNNLKKNRKPKTHILKNKNKIKNI
jgi:hypothetical protein